MKISVKKLIRQNNEKRELLSPENKKYYEDLLVYIRANLTKEERATEEVLLEMLDHLLEAQKDGKTAVEVFGKNPKELGDEILAALPEESRKHLMQFAFEILFTFFGWYLVVGGLLPLLIPRSNKNVQTIFAGNLVVSVLFLTGSLMMFAYLYFELMKKEAFQERKNDRIKTILIALTASVLFVLSFIVKFSIEPFGPAFEVSSYTIFGIGCFFLLCSYLLKKIRENHA